MGQKVALSGRSDPDFQEPESWSLTRTSERCLLPTSRALNPLSAASQDLWAM